MSQKIKITFNASASNIKQILRGTPNFLVQKIVIKIFDKEVHSVKNLIFSGVTG